jgi:hypothetical protein
MHEQRSCFHQHQGQDYTALMLLLCRAASREVRHREHADAQVEQSVASVLLHQLQLMLSAAVGHVASSCASQNTPQLDQHR